MVWDALDEQDELKRDHLLNAADIFLQNDTQETESTPFVDGQNTAAKLPPQTGSRATNRYPLAHSVWYRT